MTPNSVPELGQQILGLISRAFLSFGDMMGFLFVSFIKFSPLPDEVDFLLICLLVIWLISLLIRLFRGKQA